MACLLRAILTGIYARDNNNNNIPQVEGEIEEEETPDFLICFELLILQERDLVLICLCLFTLVAKTPYVTLSSVREEQLAVLFQNWTFRSTEIWISNKIDPNTVSWSKLFLRFRMREIPFTAATFFVDEKNKVAVVFDKGKCIYKPTRNTTYIWILQTSGSRRI